MLLKQHMKMNIQHTFIMHLLTVERLKKIIQKLKFPFGFILLQKISSVTNINFVCATYTF